MSEVVYRWWYLVATELGIEVLPDYEEGAFRGGLVFDPGIDADDAKLPLYIRVGLKGRRVFSIQEMKAWGARVYVPGSELPEWLVFATQEEAIGYIRKHPA